MDAALQTNLNKYAVLCTTAKYKKDKCVNTWWS